jgi:hypothetical protein
MATWAIRPIHPVHRRDRDVFKFFPQAAAQTFKRGALLVIDAGGAAAECGADPASIAGVALADAADYSWQNDTFGTVDPGIPVALADQEFRGTLEGTFAASDIGAAYGVVLDASGYWTVDRSDTSATRVRITGVDDEVEVGDVNAPVRFVFLTANQQEVL